MYRGLLLLLIGVGALEDLDGACATLSVFRARWTGGLGERGVRCWMFRALRVLPSASVYEPMLASPST